MNSRKTSSQKSPGKQDIQTSSVRHETEQRGAERQADPFAGRSFAGRLDDLSSQALRRRHVLKLQRQLGNGYVQRMLDRDQAGRERVPAANESSGVLQLWPDLWGAIGDLVEYVSSGSDITENATYKEMVEILKKIPTGQAALDMKDKYKVKVREVQAGEWISYDSSTNTIRLDLSNKPEYLAMSFVHEMNHAQYKNEGKRADISALSRDEYIKSKVEEEATGTIKSVEAKMELEGTDVDVTGTTYPLEKTYRKAYKKAVDAAQAKDPSTSEGDLREIGKEAGKKAMIEGYMNGDVDAGKSGKSYPEYYGDAWDKANGGGTP